ncbi:unnamed protein product [Spirodela intermedia]|uniref:Transcription factor CBF/NF-Y/archaeal histone domain-containing protein n=1 Tax=Spirodela intermedia TaxID=51605 RepID=A0A7I8JNS8_SPIIN|nr:unnamed protein product [Spirodela intermedia]CAA6671828.1 unnamed protein product [Spirodela intermedia]
MAAVIQSEQNPSHAEENDPENGSDNDDAAQGEPAPAVPGGVAAVNQGEKQMPIANVIRIMRKVLPSHAKISEDAKEAMQDCVSEYISYVTAEANQRCHDEQRKTITPEDLIWAMSRLGFTDYVEPLSLYLQRHREFEGIRRHDPLPLGSRALPPMAPAPAFAPAPLNAGMYQPPAPPMYNMMGPQGTAPFYYPDDAGSSSSAGAGRADGTFMPDDYYMDGTGWTQGPLYGYDPYNQFK